MEHLTKQQLVLLALLISFVTSLATGIVTVSLMSQAPQGVAQTINQVIERTIEKTVTNNNAAVSTSNATAQASSKVMKGIVKLRSKDFEKAIGLGIILNTKGVILADKTSIAQLSSYEAVFPDGSVVPVSVIQSQLNGSVIFLAPVSNISRIQSTFTPVTVASSITIGEDAFSLSVIGTSTSLLGQGILTSTRIDEDSSEPITSTISSARLLPGSPLFNGKGEVIGMKMNSLTIEDGSAFFPIGSLRAVIPSI